MPTPDQSKLIEQIERRYQLGDNFARTYIEQWNRGGLPPLDSPADLNKLKPPHSVWLNYALSTNQRSNKSWKQIARYLPGDARRYLDVGCAYGGSLVAATKAGLQVTGLEIDERLIQLGTANCTDHDLHDCIHRASILDEDLPERFGSFDLITIMSVIEHVMDVSLTLEHCVELLAPGGVLFMEIPNKLSTTFVARDPHYHLFGITLLERPEAEQYHQHFYSDAYDVGHYHELGDYRNLLHNLGCETYLVLSHFHSVLRLLLLPLLLVQLRLSSLRYQRSYKGKLPREIAHEIDIQYRSYLDNLRQEFFHLHFKPASRNSYQAKYLLNVWTLIARKINPENSGNSR